MQEDKGDKKLKCKDVQVRVRLLDTIERSFSPSLLAGSVQIYYFHAKYETNRKPTITGFKSKVESNSGSFTSKRAAPFYFSNLVSTQTIELPPIAINIYYLYYGKDV